MSRWLNKALSSFLILAMMAAIAAIVYIVTASAPGEKFTEFYILGADGKADGYPGEITLGSEASVIVGIANQEHEKAVYRVTVRIDEVAVTTIGPVPLDYKAKWEQEVNFKPSKAGQSQKVEFLLYKAGQEPPYLTLHLWINVKA